MRFAFTGICIAAFTGAFFSAPVVLAQTSTVSGVLLERGTRKPLEGVNLFLFPGGVPAPGATGPAPLRATSAKDGRFSIESVPDGEFSWVVNATGYERLELKDRAPIAGAGTGAGAEGRRLYLERTRYDVYETTVFGRGEKKDDTTRSLKASQITQIPGSGNDPIKAIQNLPGVNRPAPLQSQVIIQGSAPEDTRYQINGHEVPIIFHFGGLTSVVPPESLDRVDYLSAGYGPENGRAIGGLVGAVTRSARDDRLHGTAFLDVFNAGLFLEGPLSPSSRFLFGVRKSYIGEVLRAVLPEDGDFNLTVAPSFSDLTAQVEVDVTPIDQASVLAVGSLDTLEFLLAQPVGSDPSFRGDFYSKTAFFRLIPQWKHKHGENTVSRWSLGFGKDWIRFSATDNYFNLASVSLSERVEVEHAASALWKTTLGLDSQHRWTEVDLLLRDFYFAGGVANPYSSGTYRNVIVENNESEWGAYWKNEVRLGASSPVTLLPSLRAEAYTSTDEAFALPRLGARYRASDSLLFRASGGLYAQPPQPQELDPTVGNPDVKSPRAWHLSAGAEKDFRQGSTQGWVLNGGGFYKWLDRLVIPSTTLVTRNGVTTPEFYSNAGSGRAYGLEALLKMDFTPWSGWLSYTLSRSTREEPGQSTYLSQYDQTHLLTLIASRELPSNWRVAARFRYVTGEPSTPITGAFFDSDNDVFVPVRGPFFSERLGAFAQLDFRVDKRWIFRDWILSLYLDIQNITNRRNAEQFQYAYDYSSRTAIEGLPILPTLGLKGEF